MLHWTFLWKAQSRLSPAQRNPLSLNFIHFVFVRLRLREIVLVNVWKKCIPNHVVIWMNEQSVLCFWALKHQTDNETGCCSYVMSSTITQSALFSRHLSDIAHWMCIRSSHQLTQAKTLGWEYRYKTTVKLKWITSGIMERNIPACWWSAVVFATSVWGLCFLGRLDVSGPCVNVIKILT